MNKEQTVCKTECTLTWHTLEQ